MKFLVLVCLLVGTVYSVANCSTVTACPNGYTAKATPAGINCGGAVCDVKLAATGPPVVVVGVDLLVCCTINANCSTTSAPAHYTVRAVTTDVKQPLLCKAAACNVDVKGQKATGQTTAATANGADLLTCWVADATCGKPVITTCGTGFIPNATKASTWCAAAACSVKAKAGTVAASADWTTCCVAKPAAKSGAAGLFLSGLALFALLF